MGSPAARKPAAPFPLATILTMKRLALALLVLLAVAPAGAAAPSKPDPRAPGLAGMQRLEALLERVKLEQRSLKTLEASFVQNQESDLLVKPERSTGTFSYAAPDRVRWEYREPNPVSVVIHGDEMTTWYRDLKRADKLKIGRYSNQVFKYLGASGSLQTLLDYFNASLSVPKDAAAPYRLELTPKYQRISRRLKAMTIWIDSRRFLPVRLKYTEADGDTVQYEFQDLKVNPEIPAERFVLNLPKGVETRVIDLEARGSGSRSTP